MQLHRGNFFLIGLMGAGKTTRGRRLAARFGMPFVDSDVELGRRLGRTISELFAQEGEAFFRDQEQALLAELVQREGIVLSTGGGAVLREANRAQLHMHGTVIYLHATPEVLAQRLQHATQRPLLQAEEGILARLQSLYRVRDVLYRETAHYVFESTSDVALRLAAAVEKGCFIELDTKGVKGVQAKSLGDKSS